MCGVFWRLSVHIDSSDAIMKRNGLGFFELISGQSEGLIEVDSTASPITAGLTAALSRGRLISDAARTNIRLNSTLKNTGGAGVTRGHAKTRGVQIQKYY